VTGGVPGLRPAYLDGCRGSPRRAQVSRLASTSRPTVAGQRRTSTGFPRPRRLPADATTGRRRSQRTTNVSGVAWTWRYENSDGALVTSDDAPIAEMFPTQGDAETWIGEIWRELLDAGVDAVVLLEDGQKIYGPMSLHQD